MFSGRSDSLLSGSKAALDRNEGEMMTLRLNLFRTIVSI